MAKRRRSDAHYPSDERLVELMEQRGSVGRVAAACGVRRESLKDFLLIRPELRTAMHGAAQRYRINRFWARTDRSTGCWLWTGPILPNGYTAGLLHRKAWELTHGRPVPTGFEIDHLCHQKACIRPEHLDCVTSEVNNRRKVAQAGGRPPGTSTPGYGYWQDADFCRHGHAYTDENTYVGPNGGRQCRQCRRDAWKRMYARRNPR